ncbi:MAG: glycosyltransferase family 2 protein [Candidatus Bipolaricaulia bacterium]|jgi:glycosyltransferase involved in cell wall biosynthesis
MRLPRVSLVMPSLNQVEFLRESIESVLAQDYADLELLVQDGGSTDGSLAVLESFRGRIEFVSERDAGQADALNRGFSRLSGDVLGYLNSDDLLLPGAIRRVAEVFSLRPEAQLVYGRARYVDARGRPIGPCLTQAWDRARLADYCYIAQPAAFFRRSLAEATGPFDVGLHHALDYDFWLRAAEHLVDREVVHLDAELASCRLHGAAKTVAGWDRALSEIFSVVRRQTGYVSLWWCVAKWDHQLDGRSQATEPHPVPWRAYPPAIVEFAVRNRFRPRLLARGLRGGWSALARRLGAGR